MPTADRTTIKVAFDALISDLRSNLTAEPPTATKPFRKIVVGEGEEVGAHTRPFLSVALTRVRPIGVVDDDKLWESQATLKITADATASDTHSVILDAVGAIEDRLDTLRDSGVIEGAEGFDDREWKFDYPRTTSGARIVTAIATQVFVVKVEREKNRQPAA